MNQKLSELGLRRVVYYDKEEGWFHTWAGTSENVVAVIETLDGQIMTVPADDVRFKYSYGNYKIGVMQL